MSLGGLTKLPAMVLAWEVFVMLVVVVVVFTSLEVFTFLGYFSLPPALHPSFSGPWRPPLALSSTLAIFDCSTFARFFRHSFTASAMVLSGRFFPAGVLYLTFLHRQFWDVFVTQMRAGTPHPGSSSVPALTELSLPADAWTWTTHIVVTRPLIYQLRQWATKYRVKIKLLNMFCLLTSYGKIIKRLWTRLDKKYCLKLLPRNCLINIH